MVLVKTLTGLGLCARNHQREVSSQRYNEPSLTELTEIKSGGGWIKVFSHDVSGGLFKVNIFSSTILFEHIPFSLMKRLSTRTLMTPVPNSSLDWTSWRDSGERTGSFISRSSFLVLGAATSGYRHQTRLHLTPLRDMSQSILTTRSRAVIELGEDLDFAQDKTMPSSVTLQLQGTGGCVLGVGKHTNILIQFLVPGVI